MKLPCERMAGFGVLRGNLDREHGVTARACVIHARRFSGSKSEAAIDDLQHLGGIFHGDFGKAFDKHSTILVFTNFLL